ncbi:MAG: T9SS type A sorting domain-containing protein [Patescibacteria group bacterium]|nr:T9SS type A sorting domain-containing protein [Patescibacteria group bacterium]
MSGFSISNPQVFSLATSPLGYIFAGGLGGIYRSANPISFTNYKRFVWFNTNDEPVLFSLHQNYPNPFNPTTVITFELAEDALVTMRVYNTLGQEVVILAEQEQFSSGFNDMEFDGSGLPSSIYYYKIIIENAETQRISYTKVKKMLLLK